MSRVSLIPLGCDPTFPAAEQLAAYRSALEQAGHEAAIVPGAAPFADSRRAPGLVAQLADRLPLAGGNLVVIVDLAMGYPAEDLVAVVGRLADGPACLVVAARKRPLLGGLARRLLGTADPTSGLIGLGPDAARSVLPRLAPVGSRFAGELLARVEGPRDDVPATPAARPARPWVPMDDIRHAKRIADDRLGNLSRLFQFCFVGASGMVVDLSAYAFLLAILSRTHLGDRLLFQMTPDGSPISLAAVAAAILAVAIAMTWNFSLNRRLTFNDARRGSIARQYGRYALSNLAGVGISLAFRLLLPGSIAFFARHRLMAAVAGIVAATGISFSLSRWFVFGTRPAALADVSPDAGETRFSLVHPPAPSSVHRAIAERSVTTPAHARATCTETTKIDRF